MSASGSGPDTAGIMKCAAGLQAAAVRRVTDVKLPVPRPTTAAEHCGQKRSSEQCKESGQVSGADMPHKQHPYSRSLWSAP